MKLYYFDIYGRAEPIRMLLWHKKVDFEDVRFSQEDFGKFKTENRDKLEFGQVPALEYEGKVYTQTQAILRALGRHHGYYPETWEEGWQVDSVLDSISDVANAFLKAKFETDPERRKTFWEKAINDVFPTFLAAMEKRFEAKGSTDYIVGDKMSIADFAYAGFLASAVYNEGNENAVYLKEVFDKPEYSKNMKYASHLAEIFKEYLDNRPKPRPF